MENKKMLLRCVEDFTSGPFQANGGMPKETYLDIKILQDIGFHSECIGKVRDFFKIPSPLRIGFQPSERNPEYARQKQAMQHLRQYGHLLGQKYFFEMLGIIRGTLIKPAMVEISDYWPLYGTPDFARMKITMFIKRWVMITPVETLITVASHEMAHILLNALKSPYRKSEIATDILAIIITGPEIIRTGRIFGNRRFGYLNDEQFDIVQHAILK